MRFFSCSYLRLRVSRAARPSRHVKRGRSRRAPPPRQRVPRLGEHGRALAPCGCGTELDLGRGRGREVLLLLALLARRAQLRLARAPHALHAHRRRLAHGRLARELHLRLEPPLDERAPRALDDDGAGRADALEPLHLVLLSEHLAPLRALDEPHHQVARHLVGLGLRLLVAHPLDLQAPRTLHDARGRVVALVDGVGEPLLRAFVRRLRRARVAPHLLFGRSSGLRLELLGLGVLELERLGVRLRGEVLERGDLGLAARDRVLARAQALEARLVLQRAHHALLQLPLRRVALLDRRLVRAPVDEAARERVLRERLALLDRALELGLADRLAAVVAQHAADLGVLPELDLLALELGRLLARLRHLRVGRERARERRLGGEALLLDARGLGARGRLLLGRAEIGREHLDRRALEDLRHLRLDLGRLAQRLVAERRVEALDRGLALELLLLGEVRLRARRLLERPRAARRDSSARLEPPRAPAWYSAVSATGGSCRHGRGRRSAGRGGRARRQEPAARVERARATARSSLSAAESTPSLSLARACGASPRARPRPPRPPQALPVLERAVDAAAAHAGAAARLLLVRLARPLHADVLAAPLVLRQRAVARDLDERRALALREQRAPAVALRDARLAQRLPEVDAARAPAVVVVKDGDLAARALPRRARRHKRVVQEHLRHVGLGRHAEEAERPPPPASSSALSRVAQAKGLVRSRSAGQVARRRGDGRAPRARAARAAAGDRARALAAARHGRARARQPDRGHVRLAAARGARRARRGAPRLHRRTSSARARTSCCARAAGSRRAAAAARRRAPSTWEAREGRARCADTFRALSSVAP